MAKPHDGGLNRFKHTAAQRPLVRMLQHHQSMLEQMRLDLAEPTIVECLRNAQQYSVERAYLNVVSNHDLLVDTVLDRLVAQRIEDYNLKCTVHCAFDDGANRVWAVQSLSKFSVHNPLEEWSLTAERPFVYSQGS